jgi:hypothetical protein
MSENKSIVKVRKITANSDAQSPMKRVTSVVQSPIKPKIAIKSSSKVKSDPIDKPEFLQSPGVLNKHRGSINEIIETHFLEKVDSQANKQLKPISRS